MKKKPDESLYEAHAFLHSAKANDPQFTKEREAAEERLEKHLTDMMRNMFADNYSDQMGRRISAGKRRAKERRLQEQQAKNGPTAQCDDAIAKGGQKNGKKKEN